MSRKVEQRKRLKEETVPERTERVAAEAEQKAKAKDAAAANKAEQKAKANVAAANKVAAAQRVHEEARRTAEAQRQLGICNALQWESNRQQDVLMHAVNRTEAGGSSGNLRSAIARAHLQPHFDVGLLRRAGLMLEQRQTEQEEEYMRGRLKRRRPGRRARSSFRGGFRRWSLPRRRSFACYRRRPPAPVSPPPAGARAEPPRCAASSATSGTRRRTQAPSSSLC